MSNPTKNLTMQSLVNRVIITLIFRIFKPKFNRRHQTIYSNMKIEKKLNFLDKI